MNTVALGVDYVKVIEDRLIMSVTKMWPKESCFLAIYDLWRYSQRLLKLQAGTCAITITSSSVLSMTEIAKELPLIHCVP